MSDGNGKASDSEGAAPLDTAVDPSARPDTVPNAELSPVRLDKSAAPATASESPTGNVPVDPAEYWEGSTEAAEAPTLDIDEASLWGGTTQRDSLQPGAESPTAAAPIPAHAADPESEDDGRRTVQMPLPRPATSGSANKPTIRLQPPQGSAPPPPTSELDIDIEVVVSDGDRERLDTSYGELLLGDRIGRGGMAEIFMAERRGPQGFSQNVVVKRMLPAYAEDTTFIQRFALEASLAAKLRHPNIIEILDLGTHAGEYYIVMEFLDGMTIAKVVNRLTAIGLPVQPGMIANIGARIADALSYAHTFVDLDGTRHRIVHRDVSPENIMLTRDGRVKLLDFGVAKDLDVEGLTLAGDIVGKPLYLPPEAYRGNPPSPAWDIYALGVVLYTLLAGQAPYTLRTGPAGLVDLIDDVLQVEPPLLDEVNKQVAKPLSDIVMRAIAGDTEDRYGSAAELRDDLDNFVTTLPGYASTDPTTMLRDIGEAEAPVAAGPIPPWKQPGTKRPSKAEREQVERAARRRELAAAPKQRHAPPTRWPVLALAFVAVAASAGGLGFWWANRSQRAAVPEPGFGRSEFTIPAPPVPTVVTTGTISVECPSWGYVYLDGKLIGTCPVKPQEVKAGRHVVTLKGRGKPRKRRVEVEVGRDSLADFTVAPGGRVYTIRPGK